MALPSSSSPVNYIFNRQYKDQYLLSKSLLRERLGHARNLYRKDLLAHYGCVNAIEFSNEGELLVSGGDDRRVLLWKVEEAIHGVGKPVAMRAQHISNIFCLGYDSTNSKIFSAGNDDQVIVHDTRTGDPIDFFLHEQPVYGLSIDPLNDNVFASACDDGRVLIFDIREPASTEPFCLAGYTSAFHAVMFNPVEPRLLTTANSKEGVGLWDIRKPRQVVLRYGCNGPPQSCMSARFNGRGTHVLALRRRLPPVLYAVHSPAHVCQFDHPGYYNSCTMKSCCFAGDADDYVLSGSDDFNLYVWKIPTDLGADGQAHWIDTAHMVLKGHRSIVNQVRFNYTNYLIASSGVEKLIKFWSPFPLPGSSGGLAKEAESCEKERKVYTHEEYISLVLRSGQFMSHDYSNQSTREDPRMMAFFDSLVQREIEGWVSGSEGSSVEDGGVRGWEGRRWVPQAAVATQTTDEGGTEAYPSSPAPPAAPPPPNRNHTATSSLSSPGTSSPSLTSPSSSTSDTSTTSSSSSSSSSACLESDSDSADSSNSASDVRDHDLHALAAAYVGAISENQDDQLLPNEQVLETWTREEGSGTPNRISQLIAQKRSQLVRLARAKHQREPHQPKWRQNSGGQGASTQTSLVSIARILFPSEDGNANQTETPDNEMDKSRQTETARRPGTLSNNQKSKTKAGDKKMGRLLQRSKSSQEPANNTETLTNDGAGGSGLQKRECSYAGGEGMSKASGGEVDKLPPKDGSRSRRKGQGRTRRLIVGSKRKGVSSDESSDEGNSSESLPPKKRIKGVKCKNNIPSGSDAEKGLKDPVSLSSHKLSPDKNGTIADGKRQVGQNSKVSGYTSSSSDCTSEDGEDVAVEGRKGGRNVSRKGKRPVKLCKVLLRLNNNCEKVGKGGSVNGQGSSEATTAVNGKVRNLEQESLCVSPIPTRHAVETPDSGIVSGQCQDSGSTTNGSTTNGSTGPSTEGCSGSNGVFKRLNRRSGKAPFRNYRSKVRYDSDSN